MKDKIKYYLAEWIYNGYRSGIFRNAVKVRSIEETLDRLLETRDSLVRFGDGEIKLIAGKDLSFQKAEPLLVQRLQEILLYEEKGLLVALPDIFEDLSDYREKSRRFWVEHLLFHRKEYEKYCPKDRVYENTSFSRPYIMYMDREKCAVLFEKIRKLWEDKDVVVIEGASSHNGVEVDLLDNVRSLERIICPAVQAWGKYEQILQECLKLPKDKLILISLGPSAKVLGQDLFREGYRVLDIGNLDMEYSWFCMGAEDKTKLKKHSVLTREDNEKAGYREYLSQIRANID